MAHTPTEHGSGITTPASLNAEEDLHEVTGAGTHELVLSIKELQDDERLIIGIHTKMDAGSPDNYEVHSYHVFKNDQSEPVLRSLAFTHLFDMKYTIEQEGGTIRGVQWYVQTL